MVQASSGQREGTRREKHPVVESQPASKHPLDLPHWRREERQDGALVTASTTQDDGAHASVEALQRGVETQVYLPRASLEQVSTVQGSLSSQPEKVVPQVATPA